ncbi:hypothetical protein [Polyangium fumosum]|uniref:Uncharacterized protein n=1 Tax=Polyangium fumosum TaxID=889272 RepID=A0A4U1IXH3_9BACT|nr:hypothetical protein [Polyangium fumosum]TKC99211.1 hypothetical protein E8A74_38705 [Polyangium fumosum]
MNSWWMRGAMAATLVLAAACGSEVNQDGSGSAGGTGGAGGEGGVLPPQCVVETSETGPYEVTFQFENDGASPAFLRKDCSLEYTISSCEDGYSASLAIRASCSQACDSADGGCLACGACPPVGGVPVEIGAPTTDAWKGMRYTFGKTAEGCTCHESHVAQAGRYQIRVPVYPSDEAAQTGTPSHEVTVNFELPAPNGVVVVPIGQSP